MKKMYKVLKNVLIIVGVFSIAFMVSLFFQKIHVPQHIRTVFLFAVFIIALYTEGYIYGIISSVLGSLLINFVFTYPFLKFTFSVPVNIISCITMVALSFMTGTLTTKIKKQEALKVESERERTRANLLRSVSHDLRTPLTTIYGSASMLIENHSALTCEQIKEMLHGIQQDADWLMRLVENLLSITRIDDEEVKITKKITILDELIDSVLHKFNKRFPQQKIDLRLPNEIVIVSIDGILIEQVLLNLLENAVHHAQNMENLILQISLKGKEVFFEVIDDGCGINEDYLKEIFIGYHERKNKPLDTENRYAGIGLSVCATIVKAHGGKIFAKNNKTKGATFTFTLLKEEEIEYK